MTPSTPRRALFLLLGLGLTALTAWQDRDLLDAPVDAGSEIVALPEHPEPAKRRYMASLNALSDAADAFEDAITPSLRAARKSGGPEAWAEYHRRRAEPWAAYQAELKSLIARLEAARTDDPQTGRYEVFAALARLDLALWPSSRELRETRLRGAEERLRVVDRAELERALAELERGLSRPRLSLAIQRDDIGSPGRGYAGLTRRLESALLDTGPILLRLRRSGQQLIALSAARARAGTPAARRPLELARRLGIEVGSQSRGLIELLIAEAMLHDENEGEIALAARSGDVEAARDAFHEGQELSSARRSSERMRYDISRLGFLDLMVVPAGGWSPFDVDAGRRSDFASWEAALLWALLALMLASLRPGGLRRRLSCPQLTVRGWTLGDALSVALPSFGLAAVLALFLCRMHPLRAYGITFRGQAEILMAQSLALLALAEGLHFLLLRRRVRACHGLGPRASGSLPGLAMLAVGAYLTLSWVGFESRWLLAVSLPLQALGRVFLGWSWRDPADPEIKRALRRYRDRVGLVSLGLGLTLVAAVNLSLVQPRRLDLIADHERSLVQIYRDEAGHWGQGALRNTFRELRDKAPRAPRPAKPR